ncbi:MAG: hypothetical protein R6X25_16175 [Candidatus Krumholzibacteriia bacterium]
MAENTRKASAPGAGTTRPRPGAVRSGPGRPAGVLRRTCAAAALLLLAGMLGGCLFEPRSAEPPVSGDVIQYSPQTSARSVWANMELALENTDPGGWDQNVSADFRYLPDPDTEVAHPTVNWENWGKADEMDFIVGWFGSNVEIEADLVDDPIQTADPGGLTGEWELIYLIRVTDEFGRETRYRGRAFIGFESPGNFWYVSHWRDVQGEEDPVSGASLQTLGAIRGAIAAN